MSLEGKLAEIRAMAKSRIPPDALAKMAAATAALRDSGIVAGVIKVGQKLPPFSLTGAHGNPVESGALLANGGLVITVFRGHW